MFSLFQLQQEQAKWSKQNFGEQPAYFALLGAVEELGELAHAHLEQEQDIRGTKEKHLDDKYDAIGDIVIYLVDYCWRSGIDFELAVESTWDKVKLRDRRKDKLFGNPNG